MSVLKSMAPYAKAVAGAVVAGLTALLPAIQDGNGVSAAEWIVVAIAVLGGLGIVYAVPNRPAG
jgi:hypothetical protein